MNSPAVQPGSTESREALRAKLRGAGVLLFFCDAQGTLEASRAGDDRLVDVLARTETFQRALATQAPRWQKQKEPQVVEATPGLWLVPIPIESRRRRSGYAVAAVVARSMLDARQVDLICGAAGDEVDAVRRDLSSLPPASPSEIPRLAALVRTICADHATLSADREAIESVGQQLAESYEEINLLYTITRSITEVDRPERFVALACRELLATLPYAWIGAQLADDEKRLKRLSKRFIAAGDSGHSNDVLSALALDMLDQADAESPLVFEPGLKTEHSYLLPMGRTVLAYPISRDGQVIGLIIAGEKQGTDKTVSSVDVKLIGATASHLAIFIENAALYEDLNTMFVGALESLTSAIDAKDRYTCGHSRRVAHLTRQLAEAVGMDEYTAERMHIAGLVHDVGKIGVPEIVLTKPGRLSEEEFDLIKKHPEIGHRILKDIPQLADILPGVLHHHEAWAGGGYPKGLQGEEIPLVARLIALADSFDAMSSTRTYRSAMSRDEVLAEIERCTGTQFDPQLAPIFMRLDFAEYDRLVSRQHERDLREGRFGGRAA